MNASTNPSISIITFRNIDAITRSQRSKLNQKEEPQIDDEDAKWKCPKWICNCSRRCKVTVGLMDDVIHAGLGLRRKHRKYEPEKLVPGRLHGSDPGLEGF